MKYILHTEQLSFSYSRGGKPILNNLDLAIESNSVYGFLGQNGAGKTTTIKAITGLLPASGNILFRGQPFRNNNPAILKQIGTLIEQPCFYNNLTGYESLRYLAIIHGCDEKRINNMFELVGLVKAKNKKVRKYSTGMKQRLGIAMALLHDPSLLIFDEPFNGLDPEGVYELRQLVIKLSAEGKTVFLSSHILGELEKICSHIGVLHDGRLLYQGSLYNLVVEMDKELLITTPQIDEAEDICRKHQITVNRLRDNILSFQMPAKSSINDIIELFVSNNIRIDFIEMQRKNLETIYINLINKKHE